MMSHVTASCFALDIERKKGMRDRHVFANLKQLNAETGSRKTHWADRKGCYVYYDHWQTENTDSTLAIYSKIHAYRKARSFQASAQSDTRCAGSSRKGKAVCHGRSRVYRVPPAGSSSTNKACQTGEPTLSLTCLMRRVLHNYRAVIQYWRLYSSLPVSFITPYHWKCVF